MAVVIVTKWCRESFGPALSLTDLLNRLLREAVGGREGTALVDPFFLIIVVLLVLN